MKPAPDAWYDAALADNQAYSHVESLVREVGPRFAGSEGDAKAVAWALARMRAIGLQNVHAEPVKVPHWVRGPTSIELRGDKQPLSGVALGGSVPTPKAGIEAQVLQVKSIEELEWTADAQVKGRIVFFNYRMERKADGSGYAPGSVIRTTGPSRAARKGAVAVVIRSIGTDSEPVGHTGMTRYADDLPKVPAAALAPPDADRLEAQLAKGSAVRLKLKLESQMLPEADSANVVGDVPGEGPNAGEIVLLGAHLDSWDITPGANDDGAGVAIMLEAARQVLVSGRKPKRTIRVVLYANEEFGVSGGKAYAAAHAGELDRHVLAMESDFGSGPNVKLNARVPESAWNAVQGWAGQLGIEAGDNNGHGGTDVGPLMAQGVPVLDPRQDGTHYFDLHHTVNDTMDRIDRAGLSQGVRTYAALAWLASESPALGRLDAARRAAIPLRWSELEKRPLPPPALKVPYGAAPQQFGELRLPPGRGPFPVVELIHGGCWLNEFGYQYMTRLAQAFTASGFATWTIEYRRLGDEGGGYPGTFEDAATATHKLRQLAETIPLDLSRVVTVGHSAGGQLALWLGAQAPGAKRPLPLRIRGVVGLAAITDLATYASVPNCGESVVPLMGGTKDEHPDRYAFASPIEQEGAAPRVILLLGDLDAIVPMDQARRYAETFGDKVTVVPLADTGHFEPVSLVGGAWPKLLAAVREVSGVTTK